MQKSIAIAAVLAVVAFAAACGGRIETVTDTREARPEESAADTTEPAPAALPPPPPSSPPSGGPAGPVPGSCATFDQVLWALDAVGCSASACHGSLNLPLIDAARPLETKRGFYEFVLSNGMRYVDFRSLDPKSSAMACNLRGSCGVAMPLGGSAPEWTIDLVDRWLACGAPP
jgi:hypothetical protein